MLVQTIAYGCIPSICVLCNHQGDSWFLVSTVVLVLSLISRNQSIIYERRKIPNPSERGGYSQADSLPRDRLFFTCEFINRSQGIKIFLKHVNTFLEFYLHPQQCSSGIV